MKKRSSTSSPKSKAAQRGQRTKKSSRPSSSKSRSFGSKSAFSGVVESSSKPLIIVESPTKASTLSRFLGREFQVLASKGHIYDLPEKSLGVDIENGFEPTYVPLPSHTSIIEVIQETAARAPQIYIATDPDREGEAIAYHITQAMGKSIDQVARVEFHEITSQAVRKALANPGKIQMKRVEAQQARRVLDRLVGYMVSPILWKTVANGLSAGRVQSVALRLICEREAEIENFISVEYWTIEGEFLTPTADLFRARLVEWQGEKILTPTKTQKVPTLPDQKSAEEMINKLIGDRYAVSSVNKKVKKKIPPPPFTTSTLQQEGNRILRLSTRKVMSIAQTLYEGVDVGDRGRLGLITYMRTDSTRVSPEANARLREFISQTYGDNFLSSSTRTYKNKKTNIQDAHEAIRPTDVSLTPEKVKPYLTDELFQVYALIWRRFVATQMREALFEVTTVEVTGERGSLFRASSSVMKDPGFLILYPEMTENLLPEGKVKGRKSTAHSLDSSSRDKEETRKSDSEERGVEGEAGEYSLQVVLPEGIKEGLEVQAKSFIPEQHFTEPPPHYTEASLVEELDEKGIGRPSTYAVIISTLFERRYVKRNLEKKSRTLHPTPLGRVVNDILVRWFPQVFSVGFTAQMETGLDRVEEEGVEWRELVREFYLPFSHALTEAERNREQIKGQTVETLDRSCPECGAPLVLRWGKNGRFISCSRFPHCRYAESFPEDGEGGVSEIPCPQCGKPMKVKIGRFGKFLRCSDYPHCQGKLPFTRGEKCIKPGCSGYIAIYKSKRGRNYYRCTNSSCDFSTWQSPIKENCPQCGAPTLFLRSNNKRQQKFCLVCRWVEEEMVTAETIVE